jgi:hypothetical protein
MGQQKLFASISTRHAKSFETASKIVWSIDRRGAAPATVPHPHAMHASMYNARRYGIGIAVCSVVYSVASRKVPPSSNSTLE